MPAALKQLARPRTRDGKPDPPDLDKFGTYAWVHASLIHLRSDKVKIADAISSRVQNAQFSLATSKTNYIDPRVIVSFCKRSGLDLSKVLNQTQIKKFPWALGVGPDYRF